MPVLKKPKISPETTGKKQGGAPPWQPGQSGNPAGRPKGSRNKLAEEFISAMHDDFMEHGPAVISTVRAEKPDQYLKVIASILPKELHVKDASLGDMSDEELINILATLRAVTGADGDEETGGGTPKASRKTGVRTKPSGLH